MAVRLHMNVGLVAEDTRLADSADNLIVVEPVIGSTARTKGSLYLLVTGAGGRKLRDATKIVAERIRDDYYYDLSAGISVCLRKAVNNANKVLLHASERPNVEPGEAPPVGVALAVIRGNELYVATVGPAEAYLIRHARLLTLPDADPESGLPSALLDGPEVWHGEIATGDCLVLVSPNVTRKIGLGPLQDTVGQLHPQAAVDQIQRQFGAGSLGATGGDGLLIVEAAEVAATHRVSPLQPVWPNDSLAGVSEHSPIPLADTVTGGVATVQSGVHQAQVAADGWLRRGVYNLFDRMPERQVRRGRVTPLLVRRERQQRAAVAIMGLLLVTTVVASAMWFFAGPSQSQKVETQVTAQQAFQRAENDIDAVYGGGRDMVVSDPQNAFTHLSEAFRDLNYAGKNGFSDTLVSPLLDRVTQGLNDYYGVTVIQPQVVASWSTDQLSALVLGPDGAAYLIDSTVGTVYRVDLASGTQLPMMWAGEPPTNGAGIVGRPRLLGTGGQDLLIIDDFNNLWRLRPVPDSNGRRTFTKINIPDNENWGTGARAIGTFIVNPNLGLYNFYIVLPTAKQIMKYPPSADGSGYPKGDRSKYLSVDQDVTTVDDMYVDGTLYLLQNGAITRYEKGGAVKTWKAAIPKDTADKAKLLRTKASVYTRMCADNPNQDQGTFYLYDNANRRIVAIRKTDGAVMGEYVVASNQPWLSDVRGMFVVTDTNGANPVLYWVESGSLMMAPLTASSDNESPSPSASGATQSASAGSRSAKPTAAPTKKK